MLIHEIYSLFRVTKKQPIMRMISLWFIKIITMVHHTNHSIIRCYLISLIPQYTLRIPAKIAKFCNIWTFWPVIQLINHLFKIWQKAFLPNVPSMHVLLLWRIGLKGFCRILKRFLLLAELQAKMSRNCNFLLFWHHNYEVSLIYLQ